MFVNIDGVVIRKKYIGYAYISEDVDYSWKLHIVFCNENHHADSITLRYTNKQAAEKWLNVILELE